MAYCYVNSERKPLLSGIRAILFDWAGTTVDFGCMAPAQVFGEIFRSIGIDVTEAEARGPMGQAKVDHIRSMLHVPRIQAAWNSLFGRSSTEQDVEDLYATFLPLQKSILAHHSDVIPGVSEAVHWCRQQGLKIGSTTGYTRALMDVVEPLAEAQGYRPDVTVCSDEVPSGRPAPWQVYRAAEQLQVYPMNRILVIDDSLAGIEAGQHAGCLTAAVITTGNAMGLSATSLQELDARQRTERIERIAHEFVSAGTDIVIESVAELPSLFARH